MWRTDKDYPKDGTKFFVLIDHEPCCAYCTTGGTLLTTHEIFYNDEFIRNRDTPWWLEDRLNITLYQSEIQESPMLKTWLTNNGDITWMAIPEFKG